MGKVAVTRTWHSVDVVVGLIAVKDKPSRGNYARLALAIIGLAGNIVIAERDKWQQMHPPH